MAEIYQVKEALDTVLLVNEPVESVVYIAVEPIEKAVYISTERNGTDGEDGEGSTTYTATLGSVTSITISSATHDVPTVKNVKIYHPDGYDVSVTYRIVSNNVTIDSNVNLLNHSVKIY